MEKITQFHNFRKVFIKWRDEGGEGGGGGEQIADLFFALSVILRSLFFVIVWSILHNVSPCVLFLCVFILCSLSLYVTIIAGKSFFLFSLLTMLFQWMTLPLKLSTVEYSCYGAA